MSAHEESQMSDPNARIEQFRKMAEADPDNELGHFSLGKAYLDAGMNRPGHRVVPTRPGIESQHRQGLSIARHRAAEGKPQTRGDRASDPGIRSCRRPRRHDAQNEMIANAQGPRRARSRPRGAAPQQPGRRGAGRCAIAAARSARKMASPPFSNAQGKLIYEKICADCWREWIGMGTKVINELRLPLSDPQAQKIFDQHMREFLNL